MKGRKNYLKQVLAQISLGVLESVEKKKKNELLVTMAIRVILGESKNFLRLRWKWSVEKHH